MMQIEYNGLIMGNTAGYYITRLDGVYGLPIRTDVTELVGASGSAIWGQQYSGRQIGITGRVVGADPDDYFSKISALVSAFSIDGSATNQLSITKWDTGETKLLLGCKVTVMPQIAELPGEASFADFRLELLAENPFWLSQTEQSETVGLSVGTGIPLGIPMSFTLGAVVSNKATIVNAGNVSGYPEITFYGPVVNPTATNLTTGESITFTDTLLAGDVVVLSKTSTGFSATKNGVSAYDKVDNRLFEIIEGTNIIAFTASGYDASAQMLVKFRSHYISL